MRVGIIQSNYIPWRGYFDFIDDVDVFAIYDDVQFERRSWRSRNLIKTRAGPKWLTASVRKGDRSQSVEQTELTYEPDWRGDHLALLKANYQSAPFYARYMPSFAEILERRFEFLSPLNETLMRWIMAELAIKTPIVRSSAFGLQGRKTERLIDLVRKIGGKTYLSGPSASAYIDEEMFVDAGIALEYKTYDYAPYPQLWGPFDGAVSVLDLLFNVGPDARDFLKSATPSRRVV